MVLIFKNIFLFVIVILGVFILVESQDPDTTYCFQFTWVGPNYDNTTVNNHTCEDLQFDLCTGPLVTTYDLTPPNTTYMWEIYNTQVACRLSKGHVCGKWTYYYNGAVEYITYFCTKVTIDGEGSMTDGCASQDDGGYTKEICACKSYPGQMPCNVATGLPTSPGMLLVLLLLSVINSKSWT